MITLRSNPFSVLISNPLRLAGFYARLRKKYLLALAFYQKAIKLNPQSASAYYASGVCQRFLQNNELALASFNQAFLLNPNFSSSSTNFRDFFFHRGWVYHNLQNYRYAVIDFSRALQIRAGGAGNYAARASAYYQLKEYQLAFEDCNSAIAANYKDAFVFKLRSLTNFHLARYQEVIEDTDRILSQEPENVAAYINRGVSYNRLGNSYQALENYSQALVLNPASRVTALTYYNRSVVYLAISDVARARADCERSLATEPKYIPVAWMLTWLDMQVARPGPELVKRLERIASYQITQLDDPDTDKYYASLSRAVALGLKDKWDVARFELERAIALDPEQWDGYFWLSMALGYLGEPRAVEILEKGFEKDLPKVLLFPLVWLRQDRPEVSQWVDKYLTAENFPPAAVV